MRFFQQNLLLKLQDNPPKVQLMIMLQQLEHSSQLLNFTNPLKTLLLMKEIQIEH
jgi:hypothetical protein